MRPFTPRLAAAGAGVTVAALLGGAGAGSALSTATAAAPRTPPTTVTATTLKVQSGTLSVGSRIPSSQVSSRRTYFGNSFGVTLGRDHEGALYPVQTGNGGRTWRTDGPALFLPTADAPLAVSAVTASSKSLQYAFGGGGSVVDVTREGGPIWRSALFQGTVVGVVPGTAPSELIAFVDGQSGATYQYVTRNGGGSWSYTVPTTTDAG